MHTVQRSPPVADDVLGRNGLEHSRSRLQCDQVDAKVGSPGPGVTQGFTVTSLALPDGLLDSTMEGGPTTRHVLTALAQLELIGGVDEEEQERRR